jgi:hypothetical protein
MNGPQSTEQPSRKVFISYAQADKKVANQIANALSHAGVPVSSDRRELAPGDSDTDRIESALSSSDMVLVLLSSKSVTSRWLRDELTSTLARELKDRAITLIPAMIEDCQIPPLLGDRPYLDLRYDLEGGIKRLIDQLRTVRQIQFSQLDAQAFENLVLDLLAALGFSAQRLPPGTEHRFDIIASYRSRDPFGAEKTDTWFVEVKFYRKQRVGVDALHQSLHYLVSSANARRAVIVTNGTLTSVAREFLAERH